MRNLILSKISKRAIFSVLLLFGLVISTYSLLAGDGESTTEAISEEKRKISVETIKLAPQNIGYDINLSGTTKPMDEVMVSPMMSGKIVSFYVNEGERVNIGQVIAQLEQDSTLLASHNNARTSLTNTIATTNQDISNAELAVITAETNLTNIRINAEENIRNAELAIDSAEVSLESAKKSIGNTQNSSEQSVQNAYDNIRTTMQSNLSAIKIALTAIGDIIGEDPGTPNANDGYEDVLGVRNSQSLTNAKSLFFQAKKSYDHTENNYYGLNNSSLYTEIDVIANETSVSLYLIKEALSQTLVILDNTITKSGFTTSDLSALKTSINSNLTSVNTAINTLQTKQQAITSAKLSSTSGSDSMTTTYDSAKKNLEKAEQGLVLAKIQAKTQIEAAEKQLESTKANLESAKKRAQLQVSSAQGQVNSISAQLGNTTITAPISGIINQVLIEKGEMAAAGKPIAIIVNAESIKIELAVTEFDIGRVLEGQEAKILLSAYPEEEFFGSVYYVGLVADQISKKFPIKIQVFNEDKKIKAGMVAQVKILSEEQGTVLTIPKTAIFTEEGLEKVYVVDENKRIKRVSVKTESVDEETALIKDGLLENDIVVINGNYELKEGDSVVISN
jgi:RND family efflux transporter MFP subunit